MAQVPKLVDHEERGRAIDDAVIRLAASEGLSGASMRRVAADLGVSLGTVQHYRASVDEMLDRAFRRIGERRTARVQAELTGLRRPPTPREILHSSALAGVPLDDVRTEECLAEAAYLGRWIAARASGSVARDGLGELLGLFEAVLGSAAAQGELVPGVDVVMEARTLWAIVSSQAMGVLTGSASGEQAVAVLDHWFGRVFA